MKSSDLWYMTYQKEVANQKDSGNKSPVTQLSNHKMGGKYMQMNILVRFSINQ